MTGRARARARARALVGVELRRPLTGRWPYGAELPPVVRLEDATFSRSTGIDHEGVRAHYREARGLMSRHLYVLEDGTYRVEHVDYFNPDKGICNAARHWWYDVHTPPRMQQRGEAIGQTAASSPSVARWTARNAAVRELADLAASFAWPAEIVDEVPDPSETRDLLRELRETYQGAIRTRLAAYRANRDRGDEAAADSQIAAMRETNSRMARNVRDLGRIFDRTIVERLAIAFDEAEAAAAGALRAIPALAAQAIDSAQGMSSTIVLLAIGGALLYMFSRSQK